jgi:outer membrane murein-binding lipoprotein Lpp
MRILRTLPAAAVVMLLVAGCGSQSATKNARATAV